MNCYRQRIGQRAAGSPLIAPGKGAGKHYSVMHTLCVSRSFSHLLHFTQSLSLSFSHSSERISLSIIARPSEFVLLKAIGSTPY